jgi:hypothetical protein
MFSETYGEEAIKKSSGSKRAATTWKTMKEAVVQDLIEPMKTLKK